MKGRQHRQSSRARAKVKKNDTVLVVAGTDRGLKGKVMWVSPTKGTAIVERANMVKRHTRPNPNKQIQGGVLEKEAPIRLSNLRVVCPECGEPARLGRRRLEDASAARVCKRCNASFT